MDVAHRFKLVLIGDSNVGKTTFMQRVRDPVAAAATWNTKTTVGSDFAIRKVFFGNETAEAQLWDTAGQERFRAVTKSYYRSTDCFILMYDIANRGSYMHLMSTWLPDIGPDSAARFALVGNKADLEENRQVGAEEVARLCKAKGWFFAEVSSEMPGDRAAVIVDTICAGLFAAGPPKRPAAPPERTVSLNDAREASAPEVAADAEAPPPPQPASRCSC